MKGFFKKFPKIQYPIRSHNHETGETKTKQANIADIMVRYRIKKSILNNKLSYYTYYWKDQDRLDTVANMYYGDPGYAWVVAYSGEIFDWLYDLPLPDQQFNLYLQAKYGKEPETLKGEVDHYEDGDGYVVDFDTFLALPVNTRREVSVFDAEFNANERRRQVKLLDRAFIGQITEEFEEEMDSLKERRENSTLQGIE